MRVLDGGADVEKQFQTRAHGQVVLLTIFGQRRAFDIFHHQILPAFRRRAAVEQTCDVRMFQVGEHLTFLSKAVGHLSQAGPDEFDGDLFAKGIVITHGQIDYAHPAASEFAFDAVRAQLRTRERLAFRLLIDRVRGAHASRRIPKNALLPMSEAKNLAIPPDEQLLLLDEALQQLEGRMPRAGQVVELRYFAGLTEDETARLLNISVTTVKRDWAFAKLWLFDWLEKKRADLTCAQNSQSLLT